MDFTMNYWAILTAAVASIIIGSVWYGPLFGKKFMQAMGMDKWSEEHKAKMKKSMMMSYVGQCCASMVMFFVLDWYIITSMHTGIMGGIANAFGLWIGFVVPLALGDVLWGGKKSLFWMNIGNMFVTLLVAGAILGGWR
jgi:hypothetical protein